MGAGVGGATTLGPDLGGGHSASIEPGGQQLLRSALGACSADSFFQVTTAKRKLKQKSFSVFSSNVTLIIITIMMMLIKPGAASTERQRAEFCEAIPTRTC